MSTEVTLFIDEVDGEYGWVGRIHEGEKHDDIGLGEMHEDPSNLMKREEVKSRAEYDLRGPDGDVEFREVDDTLPSAPK